MQFEKIVLSNFFRMGEGVEIPLNLPGLTLITGENHDAPFASSNGAAKTTILNGIVYNLFGKCPNGASADDVINEQVGQDCKVELHFSIGEKKIKIVRTRADSEAEKPNDLLLLVNDKNISGSSNEITQELIEKLVGYDFHTFCALMPGLGVEVASLTDTQIKTLLERILRTEELATAYKLAQDKLKLIEKDIEVSSNQIKTFNENINEISLRLINYKQKAAVFDNKKQAEVDSLRVEIKKLKQKIKEAKASYTSSKNALVEVSASEQILLAQKLQNLKNLLAAAKQKTQENKNKYIKAQAIIQSHIDLLKTQAKDIEALEADCPTCTQPVSSQHKQGILNNICEKIVKLTSDFSEIEYDYSFGDAIGDDYNVYCLTEEVEIAQKNVNEATKTINVYEASKKELFLYKEIITEQLSQYSKLVTQLKDKKAEENSFLALCTQEEKNLADKNVSLAAFEATHKEQKEQRDLYKFWVNGFSVSGIRSHMMEGVTPYLNERAKYYSDVITNGEMSVIFNTKSQLKSGKNVEKFRIEVTNQHGASSWKMSSKGERSRANLVIALVLGDLASLRGATKLSFRAIDEMLDAVDDLGDDAILGLLQTMASEYGSIYLITHKSTLKNKIARELIIQKKDGLSSLKEIIEKEIDNA